MGTVKHITSASFKSDKLLMDGIVIIECYKKYAAPLYIMEPILKKLRKSYKNNFSHYRLKIERNPEIAENFYFEADLIYLIFNKGILKRKVVGLIPLYDFIELLKEVSSNK